MNCGKTGISIGGTLAAAMLVLCLPAVGLAEADGGTFMVIVEDGRPMATIITSPDAPDVVNDAAKDLQLHVEKISGAKLPIGDSPDRSGNLILLGRMPAVDNLIPDLDQYDLGHDGAVIRLLAKRLILTGKSDGYNHVFFGRTDCGTPNAVYMFLESLGCRWYMPGDDGEVVPKRSTITVSGVDVVSKPDYRGRNIGSNAAWNLGGKDPQSTVYKDYRVWRARNRVSGNTYHEGHGMYGLLPKGTYGGSHPEYFALVKGRRQTDAAAQFCLSNPDVLNIVTAKFRHFINDPRGEGKPIRSYPVGQYDSWLWCECEKCRAMYGDKTFIYRTPEECLYTAATPGDKPVDNVANGYLKFVNAVAERVEKANPNCLLTYYAVYNIPGFPEVKPRDNVLPVICHIAPEQDVWRSAVLKWARISKHLYYYTYMGHRLARPKLDIADGIRWCYQNKGIAMTFPVDECSPVNMLPLYLASKALWDTDTDSGRVLAEFYEGFYGPAERPMRLFWETFHSLTREGSENYPDCLYAYPESMTSEVTAELSRQLAAALSKADHPVVKRRIQSIIEYWQVVELQIVARTAMAKWRDEPTEQNEKASREAIDRTLDRVKSLKNTFNLTPRTGLFRQWLKEMHARAGPHPALNGEVLVSLPEQWLFRTDPKNIGEKAKWFDVATHLKGLGFRAISTTAHWEQQGVGPYDGYAWYVTEIVIPPTAAKHVWLVFGAVDETWKLWIDGEYTGASTGEPDMIWDQPAAIEITGKYRPGKKTRLVVRVHDYQAAGGIWKPVRITVTDTAPTQRDGGELDVLPPGA